MNCSELIAMYSPSIADQFEKYKQCFNNLYDYYLMKVISKACESYGCLIYSDRDGVVIKIPNCYDPVVNLFNASCNYKLGVDEVTGKLFFSEYNEHGQRILGRLTMQKVKEFNDVRELALWINTDLDQDFEHYRDFVNAMMQVYLRRVKAFRQVMELRGMIDIRWTPSDVPGLAKLELKKILDKEKIKYTSYDDISREDFILKSFAKKYMLDYLEKVKLKRTIRLGNRYDPYIIKIEGFTVRIWTRLDDTGVAEIYVARPQEITVMKRSQGVKKVKIDKPSLLQFII